MEDYRETLWGINPKDRVLFQSLTLLGGTAGSIILTLLELDSISAGAVPSEVARNVVLGIGASFIASGFITWGLLQAKELPMSIGDWIREATRRRSEKWDQEFQAMRFASDLPKAYEKAFREGHLEVLKEVYNLG